MSELQEDGGQGEGDEEEGGETWQVGQAGDVSQPPYHLTLSLQLESGEGLEESFTTTDKETVKTRWALWPLASLFLQI